MTCSTAARISPRAGVELGVSGVEVASEKSLEPVQMLRSRAGRSVAVPLKYYAKYIDGRRDAIDRRGGVRDYMRANSVSVTYQTR